VTENVIYLPIPDGMDMDPDRVLRAAEGRLKKVLILGITKDGLEYFAGSLSDGAEVLWMMERLKWLMLRAAEGDE
jgi:hypothetical protein